MLKITTQNQSEALLFSLEGKLAGPWVKELEQCWTDAVKARRGGPVRVDLSSVTFIDEEGKQLLKKMYRQGSELTATGCLNKCIVEGIMQSERLKEKEV
jgi:anti-anti-sigma regulatory factor